MWCWKEDALCISTPKKNHLLSIKSMAPSFVSPGEHPTAIIEVSVLKLWKQSQSHLRASDKTYQNQGHVVVIVRLCLFF